MKKYLRLLFLFCIVAAVLIVVYTVKQAAAPESAIIAKERKRIYTELDKVRMEKDPIYARESDEKLQMLDYRLALAYMTENKPDQAITVLQDLINEEEGKEKRGIPRRALSYLNEARYYKTLRESFDLKHDQVSADKALMRHNELLGKAEELRKIESGEEGKWVGAPGE